MQCTYVFAQIGESPNIGQRQEVSKAEEDSVKRETIEEDSYRCWKKSQKNFKALESDLTLESYYEQNFTQKDLFGNIGFSNIGQTVNPLQINVENTINPTLIPTGKSFNYTKLEDICFYDVKTPTTIINFENGVSEGQAVRTTFTQSINQNINYFITYNGLRSLGRYNDQFASTQKFIAGLRFSTQNNKYKFWTHFTSQNIDNEENAGLTDLSLSRFLVNDPAFANRLRLDVNLNGAESQYKDRRLYFEQYYDFRPTDISKAFPNHPNIANLGLKHIFTYDNQEFAYIENQTNSFYTSAVDASVGRNSAKDFTNLQNQLLLNYKNDKFGYLEAGFKFENIKYSNPTEKNVGLLTVPALFETDFVSFLFNSSIELGEKIKLNTQGQITNSVDFDVQRQFSSHLKWNVFPEYAFGFSFINNSAIQNYNLLFHQSFYDDFNFNNNLQNTEKTSLSAQFNAKPINTSMKASYSNLNRLPYIDSNIQVLQSGEFNLLEVELMNELVLGNYHWVNRVAYQNMDQQEDVFPIPEFIVRSTLFYQNEIFQKNAEIQTGFNAYYFSQFNSRTFFPVLNEFILSENESQQIGNYPYLDAFINMKVKRMRIYFRAEHFNSLFFSNNYLSDPTTPYRDFKFQIGIKWHLFS